MCAKKPTAIKALAGIALFATWVVAYAAPAAGVITNLSGPLMVKKADGSVRVLALKSVVEAGDTLVSEKNTYAQVTFTDNAQLTLRPDSTVRVDAFAYDVGKPEADDAKFTLLKGGVRWTSGIMGKRNSEKFAMTTPAATIAVRGTTFIAQYAIPPAGAMSGTTAPGGSLPPGLHLHVQVGAILVNNNGGVHQFTAGQFGYTRNVGMSPVLVPNNPGLKFTPPPVFASINQNSLNNNQPKPESVDCEVR